MHDRYRNRRLSISTMSATSNNVVLTSEETEINSYFTAYGVSTIPDPENSLFPVSTFETPPAKSTAAVKRRGLNVGVDDVQAGYLAMRVVLKAQLSDAPVSANLSGHKGTRALLQQARAEDSTKNNSYDKKQQWKQYCFFFAKVSVYMYSLLEFVIIRVWSVCNCLCW